MKAEAQAVSFPAATMGSDDGAALLARHQEGDDRAFGLLVERYQSPIFGYFVRCGVGSQVAEDLFQETFMRVHQAASSYSAERSFRAWLFAIATNLMRSHFRKQKVRRIMVSWWRPTRSEPGGGYELDPPDGGPGPERQTAAREQLAWVEGALERLPTRWRQALVLTQVEGMSHKEAGEALGVPATSIKTWVHRARTSLASERARALTQGATP